MANNISCMACSSDTSANVSGWSSTCCCCCASIAGIVGGDLLGDLLGDTVHHTGLDCPPWVVECGCGGDVVTACRSGSHETVYNNPSNGVTVSSVVRACRSYGLASGGECVCQRVDRDTTECSKHSFLLFIVRIQVYQCSSLVLDLV